MKIVTIPEKVLFKKAKPVKDFNASLEKVVHDMKKALNSATNPVGVGLAAPQVGLPLRIFLMKPTEKSAIRVFINPEKLNKTTVKHTHTHSPPLDENALEGCLSIPRIWGPVQREATLSLQWVDTKGTKHEQVFEGFEAVIVQHELDHLDGVLFTQRIAEQKGVMYEEKKGKLYELL